MNFLARSGTPDNMKDDSTVHDEITQSTFTEILGLNASIHDKKWDHATLNVEHGLKPLQEVLCLAFVAALSHSVKELPRQFCPLTKSWLCF